MGYASALKRLWKHPPFRRLLTLRLLSQAADGTLQVGMASYILFSPEKGASGWAVAGALALMLMPFTIIGPFVATYLDRWSRRDITLYSDLLRAGISLAIAAIIATGHDTGLWQVGLYILLLIAMSINRFMLAGLSAGTPYTVAPEEYLTASSILPTVGPLGVVAGALMGAVAKATLTGPLGSNGADAAVFAVSTVLFTMVAVVASGFGKHALGPEPGAPKTTWRQVLSGLVVAWRHLGQHKPAALAIVGMVLSRLLFGAVSVTTILAFRNRWNTSSTAALADITLWGVFLGVGLVLSTPTVPLLARRFGLRWTAVIVMVVAGLAQSVLIFWPGRITMLGVALVIGLASQAFKICVDTVVQAHVEDDYKGRVFTFYDTGFNTGMVLAAVLVAATLPNTGATPLADGIMSIGWILTGLGFAFASKVIGAALFEKGTEDLTGRRHEPEPEAAQV